MSIKSAINKFMRNKKIKTILKNSRIGANTDLVLFHIHRNHDSLVIYDKIKEKFIEASHYFLSTVGERYISLIVNEHNYEYIVKYLGKFAVQVERNVACINIAGKGTDFVPGVITYITSILSDKNINMYEFFTSEDNIIIVIDEEHAFDYVSYLKKVLGA